MNNYERTVLKTPTVPRINTLAKHRRIKSRIPLYVAPLCPWQPRTINHTKWLKNEMFITMASDGERKPWESEAKMTTFKRGADKRERKCSHQGEYLLIHPRRGGRLLIASVWLRVEGWGWGIKNTPTDTASAAPPLLHFIKPPCYNMLQNCHEVVVPVLQQASEISIVWTWGMRPGERWLIHCIVCMPWEDYLPMGPSLPPRAF